MLLRLLVLMVLVLVLMVLLLWQPLLVPRPGTQLRNTPDRDCARKRTGPRACQKVLSLGIVGRKRRRTAPGGRGGEDLGSKVEGVCVGGEETREVGRLILFGGGGVRII